MRLSPETLKVAKVRRVPSLSDFTADISKPFATPVCYASIAPNRHIVCRPESIFGLDFVQSYSQLPSLDAKRIADFFSGVSRRAPNFPRIRQQYLPDSFSMVEKTIPKTDAWWKRDKQS